MTYQELLQKLQTPMRKPVRIDEVSERERAARGEHARALLEDPTLVEAFTAVEDVYMSAWRNSAGEDVDQRERCAQAVRILDDIKASLHSYVRDGAVAFERLEKHLRP